MTSSVSDDPRIEPASDDENPVAVHWRPTTKNLWVGRAGGRHMGVIEHGRAFAVTDADGRTRGSYRSLESAMASAFVDSPDPEADPDAEFEADVAPAWEGVALAATLIGAATVLLAAYGLTLL